jgi:rod shape-determining protein MreC
MLAVPSRHRSLTLLAVALAAQMLLLAVQIKREQQVRLIRVWAVEAVTPLGRIAAWLTDGLGGTWSGYIGLRHLRQENTQLHAEIDKLKLRNDQLESRAVEADRLSNLLNFRQTHADVPTLAARVIGASPDSGSRILFLDRGSRDGIARDMGVITPDGVVGKVLAVYPDSSQVLLLSDKESGVGALLAGTRTQGPVRGSGDPTLQMEYVSNETPVTTGQTVYTSGEDRIFPKDLPVGTVVSVKPGIYSPFQDIAIRPAAHLDQLEEVLVLLSRKEFSSAFDPSKPGPAQAPAASQAAGVSQPQPAISVAPAAQSRSVTPATLPAKVENNR